MFSLKPIRHHVWKDANARWHPCRDATAGAAPMRTFRASSCAEHAVECAARPGRHDCCCCRFVWIRARVIRGQELRQQSYTAGSSLRGARGREAAQNANNRNISFMPSSTSSRKFLRLLFLQAHREAAAHFTAIGNASATTLQFISLSPFAAFADNLRTLAEPSLLRLLL